MTSTEAKPSAETGSSIDITLMAPEHLAEVAKLHAATFGPGRFARAAFRVREGSQLISPHCRSAWRDGHLIGSVTMTEIQIGKDGGHWLLGPLAVRPDEANRGLGQRLVATTLASVSSASSSEATVILVGDLSYYDRAGFALVPRGQIQMPGPVDLTRLLIWLGPDGSRTIPNGVVRPSGVGRVA